MKNKLTFVFVFLFLVSLASPLPGQAAEEAKSDTKVASPAAPGAPLLIVPESSFDFGDVKEGNQYVHSFAIQNVGTGTLEIQKVVPG